MLLRRRLMSEGVTVWMDQADLHPGTEWQGTIEKAIEDASHMIVLLSKRSLGSPEVAAEWNIALTLRRTIIPVLIEEVSIPFRLRPFQALRISDVALDEDVHRLLAVLPKDRTPRHRLVDDSFEVHDSDTALIDLWCDRESYEMGQLPRVAVTVNRYDSVKSILDDIYSNYLGSKVRPYTYGAEWILAGYNIVAPIEWVDCPGTALQDVNLKWASFCPPSKIGLSPGTTWGIYAGSALTGRLQSGVFGVVTRNSRLAAMLRYHPKCTEFILSQQNLFTRKKLIEIKGHLYSFQLVFPCGPYFDLKGLIFTETNELLKNPKLLEKVWHTAMHLK